MPRQLSPTVVGAIMSLFLERGCCWAPALHLLSLESVMFPGHGKGTGPGNGEGEGGILYGEAVKYFLIRVDPSWQAVYFVEWILGVKR